jgi:hypothetical protein
MQPELGAEGNRSNQLADRKLARSVIGRICAQDHQGLDAFGRKIFRKRMQALCMSKRGRIDGLDEVDRCLELLVHPVPECVHFAGLDAADQDERLSAMRFEIGSCGGDKSFGGIGQPGGCKVSAELSRDRDRGVADELRRQWQPMIGFRPGQRPAGLDAVEPQELRRGAWIACCDEIVTEPDLLRSRPERVGIEREHDARISKTWDRGQRPPKCLRCAGSSRIVVDRLVTTPFGFRKSFEQ